MLQRRLSIEREEKENGASDNRNKVTFSEVSNKPTRTSLTGGKQVVNRSFVLEDFALGRELGEGLFGRVYLARTKSDLKVVALKVLYKESLEKENVVEQLRREVEIHTRLRHRNIVRMYSYFHDKTKVFLVLEYCPGGTLFDALRNAPNRRFDEPYAAGVMRQLCSALAFCHRFQIVHRDIKPENILIGENGEIKLADFGWAVANRSNEQKMSRRTLCGTVDYLPPEMVEDNPYDERVDAWMVGVLLYEALVGHPPFTGAQDCETWEKISSGEVSVPSFVSSNAADLITRLLTKNPETRMTVEEVAQHPWIREHEMSDMV